MKLNYTLLAVVSAIALASGCKPADNKNPNEVVSDQVRTQSTVVTPQPDQLQKQTDEAARAAKAETQEAVQAVKEYAYAQRAEFAEKMRKEIAALNQEADQLRTRIDAADAAVRDEAQPKLQALKAKTEELNKKLDDVKSATESGWDDVKAGVKDGFEELKDSLKKAREWLREKLAS